MISKITYLRHFINDPNKKGVFRMIKEIIHYAWVKKELPTDYFRKFLYRKEIKNYTNYLSLKQFTKVIRSKNIVFSEISSILGNKLSMNFYLKNFNLPIPELVSYNLKNNYVYNKDISTITKTSDLIDFFDNIFETSKQESLFLKLLDLEGGEGAILLKKNTFKNQIKNNADFLLANSFVHQEVIKQHLEINKIHSKSVNTLRIETYIDLANNIHILSVVMRFGIGDSVIDNGSAGGFYISVNMTTGVLQGIGMQDFNKGAKVFTKHPNTGAVLENFKVPFFMEACELAKTAAKHLPNKIVGWDIAITLNGPIIVEGNNTPTLSITDVCYGGYCTHPLFKEILDIT
ncbi:sugar-transfer associated ATP-grasp domain-containing protein [Flavivirga spongiicola]|uniref:Alpha-L-glutamate ligase-related protein ATP-grasp domain-containing protein n=1 Tax=Flavivirga spongiicola TaxID=421621 RepID=A0ABU7XXH6_9FLAO|nr:sugar-transfer associated ATP-grasp domain-containing protein [Flavivirga sp. MEBiC05379]MDO5980474.1 sugar-transfer associated ATP-grasp domain-containing protein [Flavivirga sp. MEBiC05379]